MISGGTTYHSMWTKEYVGYLMADSHSHKCNAGYECVDKDSEAVPDGGANANNAITLVQSVVLVYLVLPMLLTD